MGRQKNSLQMKEQGNSPEKELNKMKASNLSDIEFKEWVLTRALLAGMQTGGATMETTRKSPEKVKMELPYDPAKLKH